MEQRASFARTHMTTVTAPRGAIAWVMRTCYRPAIVRVMLLPCHIGMCIPSAGTVLGLYLTKTWVLVAAWIVPH